MLTLEQVADLVYDVLRERDISTHTRYPGRTIEKIALIRETYMEHLAFPELPIRSIVRRRITGLITVEESAFWERYITRRGITDDTSQRNQS